MSYEKQYQVLDEILEGSGRPTSPFTAKDGAGMLDSLFEASAHIPIWVLSLGNAVVGIEELEQKMTRLGRQTRAIEIAYQHLPAVATAEKKATNKEFLVVGWDESAVERIAASSATVLVTSPVRKQAAKRQKALPKRSRSAVTPHSEEVMTRG